jgi:hypothetical protein
MSLQKDEACGQGYCAERRIEPYFLKLVVSNHILRLLVLSLLRITGLTNCFSAPSSMSLYRCYVIHQGTEHEEAFMQCVGTRRQSLICSRLVSIGMSIRQRKENQYAASRRETQQVYSSASITANLHQATCIPSQACTAVERARDYGRTRTAASHLRKRASEGDSVKTKIQQLGCIWIGSGYEITLPEKCTHKRAQ